MGEEHREEAMGWPEEAMAREAQIHIRDDA
jgi:hypothetical protein